MQLDEFLGGTCAAMLLAFAAAKYLRNKPEKKNDPQIEYEQSLIHMVSESNIEAYDFDAFKLAVEQYCSVTQDKTPRRILYAQKLLPVLAVRIYENSQPTKSKLNIFNEEDLDGHASSEELRQLRYNALVQMLNLLIQQQIIMPQDYLANYSIDIKHTLPQNLIAVKANHSYDEDGYCQWSTPEYIQPMALLTACFSRENYVATILPSLIKGLETKAQHNLKVKLT